MIDGVKVGRLRAIPDERVCAGPACLISAPTEHFVHHCAHGFRVPPHRSEIYCAWERTDG